MAKKMDAGLSPISFSVIIPTYNRVQTIGRAINSVLAQSYPHFELIIVDDGSSDETSALIQGMIDPRVAYFYQHNAGVCAARNTGANKAGGEWLCFLDSDDTVSTDWLKDFADLAKTGNYDLLFCGMELEDKRLNIKKRILPAHDVKKGGAWWRMNAGIFAVRASLFEKAGGFDTAIKFGENTELGFRLKDHHPRVGFIDQVHLKYAVSDDGGSRNLTHIAQSNIYVLAKHKDRFQKERKSGQLLAQVTAVALIRLGNYHEGRKWMWKGWVFSPLNLKAAGRACLSIFNFISSKIWPPLISKNG